VVENKDRIIFLDLLRALAVFLMLEGHTVHALLLEELRTFDSFAFSVWHNVRGFTAPIFMFTAGAVFSYLLHKSGNISLKGPRVKKGFKRVIILLFIGYMLRFPSFSVEGWSHITETQWTIFSSVDALHLIAAGLFLIIIASLFTVKYKINVYLVYLSSASFFFLLTPFMRKVEWINFLPWGIASYFTEDYGSIFPVFPWAGYLLTGAAFGYYLFKSNPADKKKTALKIGILGASAVLLSGLSDLAAPALSGTPGSLQFSYSIYLLRIGVVVLLSSVVMVATVRIKKLPSIVQLMGKHSLVIYAVHLMIVYGSALSPGLSWYLGKSLSLLQTILIFLLITILMLLLAWLIEVYKKNSNKIYGTISVMYKRILAAVR
jgi:uncharacterized membrane protein